MPVFRQCLPGLAVAASLMAWNAPASAETCAGHPDAIGTSRTLVVDPAEHPRIGGMQYGETLPLHDHEVVLTFDDGPLPKYSNQILDILASQCVKATFFTIGHMAREFPEGVKRLRAEGHTIGTHSQNHPLRFEHMTIDQVAREVDDGIASVKAALGDGDDVAPFFRIPGLLRSQEVDDFLASRGLMTWSANFPADDWRRISSARVVNLALTRLEAKGKGVLLLHDIHARTVAALPIMLRELKNRGFHIVQVVPATPDRPKTPTEPSEWRIRPERVAARWPAIQQFAFAETAVTAAPDVGDLGISNPSGDLIAFTGARSAARTKVPLPPQSIWPRQADLPPAALTALLPAPAEQLFHVGTDPAAPAGGGAPTHEGSPPHRAEVAHPTAIEMSQEREAMNVPSGESHASP